MSLQATVKGLLLLLSHLTGQQQVVSVWAGRRVNTVAEYVLPDSWTGAGTFTGCQRAQAWSPDTTTAGCCCWSWSLAGGGGRGKAGWHLALPGLPACPTLPLPLCPGSGIAVLAWLCYGQCRCGVSVQQLHWQVIQLPIWPHCASGRQSRVSGSNGARARALHAVQLEHKAKPPQWLSEKQAPSLAGTAEAHPSPSLAVIVVVCGALPVKAT